jgi:outer membrane lipoprotein LolB
VSILKANFKKIFSYMSVLSFIGVTGCVSNFSKIKITEPIKVNNKVSSWEIYKNKHMKIQQGSWKFKGVVGISMPGEAQQASVSWNKEPKQYQIKLSGPLGLGSIEIQHKAGVYELIDEKGHVYTNSDPEALLEQITGWTLPLSGADFWVLGLIKPEKTLDPVDLSKHLSGSIRKSNPNSGLNYSLNKYGSLEKLQQNGWNIDYRQYRVFNGVMLPVQIIFYNAAKQLRIKLVIQNWVF